MSSKIYPNRVITYYNSKTGKWCMRYSQYCGFGSYRVYDIIENEIIDVLYMGDVYLDFNGVVYLMHQVEGGIK